MKYVVTLGLNVFQQARDLDYADNRWIERLLGESSSLSAFEASKKGSFTESTSVLYSGPISLADRCFTTRYFVDVCGEGGGDDLCVMQHSNRICVVGLAPGHHLFGGCGNSLAPDTAEKPNHTILGVDFQLSSSFNLLNSKISGRRKRGSHRLHHGSYKQCIGYAICDRGERHALLIGGGLPGRLYESNSRLSIIAAAEDRVPFGPTGITGNNEAYLAIIMPQRTMSKTEHSEVCEDPSGSFLTKQGILTGGLTWEEYRELRKL
ncbi:Protein Abitram [Taenia solium]|eukprot:TsM_000516300 transcript=TsM_000516300 gene=TsM_000516300